MKKFILSLILCLTVCSGMPAVSNEIEEDYLDIAADFCLIGDYNSAMSYLDKILNINPNNKHAADLKKGLSHLIAQDKKTFVTGINPLVKQAQEYKREGNERMEYTALINGTKSENAYIAYYYLGNFYRNQNNYLKALDAYNGALSAKPDFSPAYLASAITLLDAGKYESAINPIDKYLTFAPDDDLAYTIRARAKFQIGMYEEAKVDIDKAIEFNNCPEYRFEKGKILYKLENYEEAKELFTKLLPEIQTSKIYEYLAYCDIEMKNYINALDNLNKALILSDDDEYLENKYNEIRAILESDKNE
ncbi:tetratricopeptide repeat protein [bacterium]|nr:tetratricopeptide repeat protein [bacterium]